MNKKTSAIAALALIATSALSFAAQAQTVRGVPQRGAFANAYNSSVVRPNAAVRADETAVYNRDASFGYIRHPGDNSMDPYVNFDGA